MKNKSKVDNYNVTKSSFTDWETVFQNPSPIKIKTLNTGTINSKISGIINLNNDNAKEIKEGLAVLPVLAHIVRHKKCGDFLIDTGFDSTFTKTIGGSFNGILKSRYFKNRYIQERNSDGIEKQLRDKSIKLKGVFLTHMHEHAAGVPSLPKDIPYVYGKGEKEISFFPIVYSKFFKNKSNIQTFDFSFGQDMPILGKCIDIFGDGSFWAVSTPGHTKGHVSYIVNGKETTTLIIGDTSVSKKGFQLGVGTGKYSADLKEGQNSLLKLKEFVQKYPSINLIYGHETDEFRIKYNKNTKKHD